MAVRKKKKWNNLKDKNNNRPIFWTNFVLFYKKVQKGKRKMSNRKK